VAGLASDEARGVAVPAHSSDGVHVPLVPSLDARHQVGRDLVWCASLDLAWQEMERLVGRPIVLRDADDAAAVIAGALGASSVRPEHLDPACYVASASRHTPAWLEWLDAELRRKFGSGLDRRLFPAEPQPDLFAAYAYLQRSWTFAVPFQRLRGWMSFGRTKVDSFSLGSRFDRSDLYERRAAQALVHHHRFLVDPDADADDDDDDDDCSRSEEFVVELVTDRRDDRLVLAGAEPRGTLAETVGWAMERLRADAATDPRARLDREERLGVPCIDFDLCRSYHELYGRHFANAGFESQGFGEVCERVRFRLDEGGAKLVSESEFRGLSLPPRTVVFDEPFLMMALKHGAPAPFLALWIETPALLVKSVPPDEPGP
jgi:hypothetical protein